MAEDRKSNRGLLDFTALDKRDDAVVGFRSIIGFNRSLKNMEKQCWQQAS